MVRRCPMSTSSLHPSHGFVTHNLDEKLYNLGSPCKGLRSGRRIWSGVFLLTQKSHDPTSIFSPCARYTRTNSNISAVCKSSRITQTRNSPVLTHYVRCAPGRICTYEGIKPLVLQTNAFDYFATDASCLQFYQIKQFIQYLF